MNVRGASGSSHELNTGRGGQGLGSGHMGWYDVFVQFPQAGSIPVLVSELRDLKSYDKKNMATSLEGLNDIDGGKGADVFQRGGSWDRRLK